MGPPPPNNFNIIVKMDILVYQSYFFNTVEINKGKKFFGGFDYFTFEKVTSFLNGEWRPYPIAKCMAVLI